MGLNPYNVWFALLAFVGFVMVAPALYNWVLPSFYDQPPATQFLATFVPPIAALLLTVSWLEPE